MNAPLYEMLVKYSRQSPFRLHMPGHKGRPLYGDIWGDLSALDVTELPQTGDLYRETEGAIRRSERLLADIYNAQGAVMLTGGSTQGIFSMLAASVSPGDTVLIDRLCHLSVINAVSLLDLKPKYVYRGVSGGVASALEAARVEEALTPEVKAFVVTSPTYNGVCSDLHEIYGICRRHGVKLLLDAAHGAHLPFVPGFENCLSYDYAVMSAHKTLPALGQAAFILSMHDPGPLRQASMLTGTSSPSYPILASIDLARAFLQEKGKENGKALLEAVRQYGGEFIRQDTDPLRVTVRADYSRFFEQNIIPEMWGGGLTVFIISLYDTPADAQKLFEAIHDLGGTPPTGDGAPPPKAKAVMTPRQAAFSPHRTLMSAKDAVGYIAAEPIAEYPPGIPVLMPGEVLGREQVGHVDGVRLFIPADCR